MSHVTPDEPRRDTSALARDHLANERTYLAWLRTAAAVMALGLAVAGFANDVGIASAIAGGLLVVVGGAGVAYGTLRFRRVTDELEQGRYLAHARVRAAFVASIVLVVTVVVALVLLIIDQR